MSERVYIRSKAGRCANGYGKDAGMITHALLLSHEPMYLDRAICGATPGERSSGWSSFDAEKVICVKCLKKMEVLDEE